MSQTFFSKLDGPEKNNRLGQLASSSGNVTIWVKGKKEKHTFPVIKFDKDRLDVVLDSKADIFTSDTEVLCTFDLRGMTFFSQVIFKRSIADYSVLHCSADLFKSERRSSFRLLTYPAYEVWAQFDLGEKYEGRNVVDMKTKISQTKLFHNFIKLVDGKDGGEGDLSKISIRVQDLSATGMAIHISEMESKYFEKGRDFKNVLLNFSDEIIEIPEVRVMYVVDYISQDKRIKKFKLGLNFPNLSTKIDHVLSSKINKLLRENDFNKDFENFIK